MPSRGRPRGARPAGSDTYEARSSSSPAISASAGEAAGPLRALREAVFATGRRAIGAGLHPTAAFGDVVHVDEERYARSCGCCAG
jgi:hypothetical protein